VKKGPKLTDDRRLNGEPLRKTVAIPILGKSRRASALVQAVEELHEAVTSVALTGIDERIWTTIGLVDSARVTASVRHYAAELPPGGVLSEDPIAGERLRPDKCAFDPDKRAFDPRLQFLLAWEERLAQAYTEWDGIVACLDQIVEW